MMNFENLKNFFDMCISETYENFYFNIYYNLSNMTIAAILMAVN